MIVLLSLKVLVKRKEEGIKSIKRVRNLSKQKKMYLLIQFDGAPKWLEVLERVCRENCLRVSVFD